ncbi:hypothetical protein RYX36_032906 [Vicia faba]
MKVFKYRIKAVAWRRSRPLNTKELQNLEKQLEGALAQARQRKTQFMIKQMEELCNRQSHLGNMNKQLKLKVAQGTCSHKILLTYTQFGINLAEFARNHQEVKFAPHIRYEKGNQIPTYIGMIGHGGVVIGTALKNMVSYGNNKALKPQANKTCPSSFWGRYKWLEVDLDGEKVGVVNGTKTK